MKKALPYIKKYGVLAGAGLVAVAGIPTSWYFSTQALASIRTEQQKKVDDANKDLSSARLAYKLEPMGAGATAKEHSEAPNAALISQTKKIREVMAQSSKKVFGEAVTFNRGPRNGADDAEAAKATLLIPALFPDPGAQSQVLRLAMARAYATKAHQDLLTKYRAGPGVDNEALAVELELKRQEVLQATLAPGQELKDLTQDQERTIQAAILGHRIRKYRDNAGAYKFFADVDGISGGAQTLGDTEPSLRQSWDWQTQLWIREDILRAASLANSGASSLVDGVVKRIQSIQIDAMAQPAAAPAPGGAPADAGAADQATVPPANLRISASGRVSGPGSGNGMYDLRSCSVVAVVSAKNLPQFLDALARTNFMTVLDCDFEVIDPAEDLKLGFYYGNDAVVRVRLRIETAWLREWTKKYMPAEVRAEVGMPSDAPEDSAAPGAAPGAGPAAPSAPPSAAPPRSGGTPTPPAAPGGSGGPTPRRPSGG